MRNELNCVPLGDCNTTTRTYDESRLFDNDYYYCFAAAAAAVAVDGDDDDGCCVDGDAAVVGPLMGRSSCA